MKILVLGSKGQLGSELRKLSPKIKNATFTFIDKDQVDISQEESVKHFFKLESFDYCINCAAYTAVDLAESEQDLCREINIKGVQYIASACSEHEVTLFHISSDYVYHNEINRPLLENDPTTPQGVYANTKLQGDFAAKSYNDKTIILRTSWVYSSFGNNFVKTMLRLGAERDQLNIVFDQIGSPTYAEDIASTILEIINQLEAGNCHYGIFNFSNEGVCSWYDFANEIFSMSKIKCNINPITSEEYPTPAQRPNYSVMNKGKIKKTYQIEIPHWKDSLKRCLKAIEKND